ncbi:trypsin-like peptidase domain-containing protein [Candidatus Chlorohelix sp.]|uniref:S1C family serine protease n=1 Tax=Candidatus Chlorohelix sp. TaxID=3139201 RepID=UPI003054EFC3
MYQHKISALLLSFFLLSLALSACSDSNSTTATVAPVTATSVPNQTVAVAATTNSNKPTTTAVAAVPTTQALSADQIESNSVVSVVKRANPAVVTVYTKATRTTTGSQFTVGTGSGAIISENGYILTNAHVVSGAQGISVAFNNGQKVAAAQLVGIDEDGDIAVLKVDVKTPAVLKFGDSSKVEIGETVIAIGAALGDFRNSVTKGVVSGLNRTIPGDTSPNVYIQTDASINHGNSGGPLLNLKGEIIGINTAVVRSVNSGGSSTSANDVAEGLGFSIPGNVAAMISEQLITKGTASKPYFGIRYQMITPAIAGTTLSGISIPEIEGAWVSPSGRQPGIVAGGPADKAGLKDNDIITAINGEPLNDLNPLVTAILKYKPNDTINLTVQRGKDSLTLQLTLGERPKPLN